jgi:hypothetical protein
LIGSGAADKLAGMTFEAAHLGMPVIENGELTVRFGSWDPTNPNVIQLNVDGGVYQTPNTVNAIVRTTGQPDTTTNGTLDMLGFLNQQAGTTLSTVQYQAAIILHELAHATGAFAADGGSFAQSWANTKKVMQQCF